MDNWYNKQVTTNPDKNDKSLKATALAVLALRDAPCYWHGHPSLKELITGAPNVAQMLGKTEGTFARILLDLRFASTRPVVRNIRALRYIFRPVPAKRQHWWPLRLCKERVSSNVSLPNLLQFTRVKVVPWVVDGAGGLGGGKTSGAGTRGVDLNVAIGGRTGYSDTNGGESSNNRSKVHADCYPAENPSL